MIALCVKQTKIEVIINLLPNGLNVGPSQSYHMASEDFKCTAFIVLFVIYGAWQLLDPIHFSLYGKE